MKRSGTDVVVDGYSEKWLRRGFSWVYPKEVVRGGAAPGATVAVAAGGGDVLGRGIADDGWIAVRVMRHDAGPLDDAWLDGVLDRAAALRRRVVDGQTTGFRLVHAENDALPGVRVDVWGDRVVIAIDSASLRGLAERVADRVIARWAALCGWRVGGEAPAGVHLCFRPDGRDTTAAPRGDGGLLRGVAMDGPGVVLERSVTLHVWPHEGPDVGVYSDMRETRAWLVPHLAGRRVLNLFAYTGAFSVAAAVGGATEVVSVDLSGKYLDRARLNFVANGLPVVPEDFVEEDVWKALDRLRRKGRRFDVVICDPPSFSRSAVGTWSAESDYPRLVAACARVLDPDGWLVCASNQGQISPHQFQGLVDDGLRKAERPGQEIWRGSASPDFPALSTFPESRYLKVAVWRLP